MLGKFNIAADIISFIKKKDSSTLALQTVASTAIHQGDVDTPLHPPTTAYRIALQLFPFLTNIHHSTIIIEYFKFIVGYCKVT